MELHLYSGVSKNLFTQERDMWDRERMDGQKSSYPWLLARHICAE